jgi:branched-chain amino acid transport system substrate-binding protein
MRYKMFGLLSALALLVTLATGCVAPPATPAPAAQTEAPAAATEAAQMPQAYKVGFVNHLTGDAAVYGQSMKMGTELAVDVINAAGGINGVPVEVIYEDDRLSAADAQTAFLKLVETDKVPVILGSSSSTISLSICPKAQEKHVVQVSQVSTAPSLKDCGKYFFSVMASDTAQGPEWVKVAEYLGVKEAAVMYINNDYGIGVKDTFVQAFEAAGGKLLIVQPFELGGKDFRTEVLKVKETNPPVVFIVDHVAESSIVFKQAMELGLKTQWVTDVSIVSAEVPQLAGKEAVEGIMGLRAGSSQTPEYKAFRDAFMKKFDKEPTIWADFAYDAMMIVGKAIEKGGYTADGIQKAMFEVADSYVGPSGAKKFDEYGISQGSYEWVTVKDGEWVLYEKK